MYRTGVRQNTLARTVGINEAYLSRIMNGTRKPGPEVQEQIASALREDAQWLFQRTPVILESPLEESKSFDSGQREVDTNLSPVTL
jgi:transcriptional regulator with XRE-family HTH domain